MTERQTQILAALKYGPLDQIALADQIGQAPFNVRAELHAMRRERLVRDTLGDTLHLWELTNRGLAIAWNADQLKLAR